MRAVEVRNEQSNPPVNADRRQLLKSGAALGATLLAPGIILHTAFAKESGDLSGHRWGLLIDTNQCTEGCDRCVSACNTENGLEGFDRPATDAQWIRKVTIRDMQTRQTTQLPLMCQHCEHPPCVDVCPTGASFKRADGIVLVDKHICIGCRYCMMACPYKARSFVHESLHNQKAHAPRGKGTVESCTLCVHRIDSGRQPACVEACGEAMLFGDLNDPASPISKQLSRVKSSQIRADLGVNPAVRYIGI